MYKIQGDLWTITRGIRAQEVAGSGPSLGQGSGHSVISFCHLRTMTQGGTSTSNLDSKLVPASPAHAGCTAYIRCCDPLFRRLNSKAEAGRRSFDGLMPLSHCQQATAISIVQSELLLVHISVAGRYPARALVTRNISDVEAVSMLLKDTSAHARLA